MEDGYLILDAEKMAKNKSTLELILPYCQEYLHRRNHPSKLYVPDSSIDRNQLAFHRSTARIRLAEGGNQSGKSRAAAQEIFWMMDGSHPYLEMPNSPCLYLVSAEYRTIQVGIYRHLVKILPRWKVQRVGSRIPNFDIPSFIEYEGNKGLARLDFISGEGTENARRKVQAAELDFVAIDEEIDSVMWEEILARLLTRGGKVIITATPFRSDQWILDLEDKAKSGSKDVHFFSFDTEAALRAGHIDKNAYEMMESILTPEERSVRIKGQSRRSLGLVYPEVDKQHIVEPFKIPKEWNRYCAIDPGSRTAAVIWLAVAPNNKCYLYRELYIHRTHIYEVANMIFAAEGWKRNSEGQWQITEETEQIKLRYIDPSEFGQNTTGELKCGNLLSGYGMPCTPARNDVEYGIAEVKRAFMPELDGIARLRIFSDLEYYFYELRRYKRGKDTRDQQRRERSDNPIRRDNHLMDCKRYIFAGGVEYTSPPDSYIEAIANADDFNYSMPDFSASSGKGERMRKHWEKLMLRQQMARKYPTRCNTPVGSEF